jgi:hypothetical protein
VNGRRAMARSGIVGSRCELDAQTIRDARAEVLFSDAHLPLKPDEPHDA